MSEALPIFAGFQFNSGGKTWEQVIPSALDEPRVVKTVRLEDAQRIIAELESQLAEAQKDAGRYRWLRSRDLNTISNGGVFAGMTPSNVVLNEKDLDCEIDAAMEASRAD